MHAPASLEEAASLLREHAGHVRLGNGCTYLMLMAAHGEVLPGHLVSLHRIPGLHECAPGRIGASVTLRELERGPMVGPERAIAMAAGVTAGPSIRSLGTLGGNLGFPDGDLIPSLLALDATVHLDDGAELSVDDWLEAKPTDRIITGVTYDRDAASGWTAASMKFSQRGMDWPVVTVSTALRLAEDGEILEARTAAQALAPTASRLPGVDAVLIGSHGQDEALDYAADAAVHRMEIRDDLEASAAYRKRVAPAIVRRVLALALRAGTDGAVTPREARA